MSCRHPEAARTASVAAAASASLVCRGLILKLMVHLHNGYRRELLKKRSRVIHGKPGIVRLEAEEEFIGRRPVAEIGSVEQRVVKLRHAVQRNHAEGRRKSGEKDGPLIRGNDEGRPRKQRTARD